MTDPIIAAHFKLLEERVWPEVPRLLHAELQRLQEGQPLQPLQVLVMWKQFAGEVLTFPQAPCGGDWKDVVVGDHQELAKELVTFAEVSRAKHNSAITYSGEERTELYVRACVAHVLRGRS